MQRKIDAGALPKDVCFVDLLSHAVYDASRDEVTFTVRGCAYVWKVETV